MVFGFFFRAMDDKVLLRVIQKACADAHLVVVALENLEVPAALAAFPELGVVGELREGDGTESELVVHLHDGRSGGDGEYLGVGEEPAREQEGLFLDHLRDAHASVGMGHDKARVGHETFSSPGFDVGESGEVPVVRILSQIYSGVRFAIPVLRSREEM